MVFVHGQDFVSVTPGGSVAVVEIDDLIGGWVMRHADVLESGKAILEGVVCAAM